MVVNMCMAPARGGARSASAALVTWLMAARARAVTKYGGRGTTATGGLIESVLNPAGPVGRAENVILLDSLAIMLAIAVPTIAAALLFAWRYRAANTRST